MGEFEKLKVKFEKLELPTPFDLYILIFQISLTQIVNNLELVQRWLNMKNQATNQIG